MADAAVVFDVDGVLLELTRAEEDAFFDTFETRYGLKDLSRDWNSYRIRNDENIVEEILQRHGIAPGEKAGVISDYLALLKQRLLGKQIETIAVSGAGEMLRNLAPRHALGAATANFRSAAKLRLEQAGFWPVIGSHAFGAEGGGHKREILARAIGSTGCAKSRIVYVGDNLNDVDAGLSNGVHFIGFSTDPKRLAELKKAGAIHASNNHVETFRLIGHLLKAGSGQEHN
jgi:phosphoglycolate phosphatase-like HAD superfamily hydrolase